MSAQPLQSPTLILARHPPQTQQSSKETPQRTQNGNKPQPPPVLCLASLRQERAVRRGAAFAK